MGDGGGGAGRGHLGLFLLGMCRWPRSLYPLQSILWPIIDSILVTSGQIYNVRVPNLIVTFYLICILSTLY